MDTNHLEQLLSQAAHADKVERNYDQAEKLYTAVIETPLPGTGVLGNSELRQLRLRARERLGELLIRLGRHAEAMAQFEAYRNEARTPEQKTNALSLIGRLLTNMGRLSEARQILQEALLVANDLGAEVQANAHLGMGNALYESGQLEEALAHLDRALIGFVQSGDREQQLRVRNSQGMAYIRLGQTDRAIKAFQEGLRLARQLGARATAILLNNLGEAYQNLFDMEQALIHHEEGLKIAESTQLASNMADLSRNMGVNLVYLGRLAEGIAYLYRALSLSEEAGRTTVKLQTLYALSLAEGEAGNLPMAHTHAQVLLELAREKSARVYEADALHALGRYHKLAGNAAQAEQYWQQASFLAHETEQRMLLWQIHAEMAEVATLPGLADVHRRIATEVIEQIAYPIADKKLREKFLAAPRVRALMTAADVG